MPPPGSVKYLQFPCDMQPSSSMKRERKREMEKGRKVRGEGKGKRKV